MTILGLSIDLAVFSIAMAVLYWAIPKGDWMKTLAKYMWLIVGMATAIQLGIDYPSFGLVLVGLELLFIGIFIFELVIDLYAAMTTAILPLLHRRFR